MAHEKLPETVKVNGKEAPGFIRATALAPEAETPKPTPPVIPKPTTTKVYNLRQALDLFKYRKIGMRKLNDTNLDGSRIGVLYVEGGTNEKHLVLFKREPYFMFGNHFPNIPAEDKGHGVICNKKIVWYAQQYDCNITVVFQDSTCYTIEGTEFWDYYEAYDTEVPHAPGEISTSFRKFRRVF